MPNWCNNRLTVVGPPDDTMAFLKAITKVDPETHKMSLCMVDAFCPLPAAATKTTTISGLSAFATVEDNGIDGYRLALAMWGTKWGDCRTAIDGEPQPGRLDLTFDTAWSPMVEGMARISAANPTLRFAMSGIEEQPCWCGWHLFVAGELVAEGDIDLDGGPAWPDDMDEEQEMEWMERQHEWEDGLRSAAHEAALAALEAQP